MKSKINDQGLCTDRFTSSGRSLTKSNLKALGSMLRPIIMSLQRHCGGIDEVATKSLPARSRAGHARNPMPLAWPPPVDDGEFLWVLMTSASNAADLEVNTSKAVLTAA